MSIETWKTTSAGKHFLDAEFARLQHPLRQVRGDQILMIGDCFDPRVWQLLQGEQPEPQQRVVMLDDLSSRNSVPEGQQLLSADAAFLPFSESVFSGVVLPHVLERHHLQYQVLREAHRVLQPEGDLIVTGFNPSSIIGIQRLYRSSSIYAGHYYSVRRIRDWLQLLGFEVRASAMFHYSPLCKGERLRRIFRGLDFIGDRWLPMLGGGYMISARKKVGGSKLVGRLAFSKPKRSAAGAVPARRVAPDQ